MYKSRKFFSLAIHSLIVVVGIVAFPVKIYADQQQSIVPEPVPGKPWSSRCAQNGVATLAGFECLLANILNWIIPIIGLATFLMLIVGSFQFLTSQGNPKEMEGAKKTISFAIFGLILDLAAWVIINFVSIFTGIDLSTFKIGI